MSTALLVWSDPAIGILQSIDAAFEHFAVQLIQGKPFESTIVRNRTDDDGDFLRVLEDDHHPAGREMEVDELTTGVADNSTNHGSSPRIAPIIRAPAPGAQITRLRAEARVKLEADSEQPQFGHSAEIPP